MSGSTLASKVQLTGSRVMAGAQDLICGKHAHKVDSFIAVTVSGRTLAQHQQAFRAAESCFWATGISTFTVSPRALSLFPDCRKMSHVKWHLFDLFPEAETILFFAPEVFFLKKHSFRGYEQRREIFFARSMPSRSVLGDMILYQIPFEEYFTTQLVVLSRAHHQGMLARARELFESDSSSTYNEEVLINRARIDLQLAKECFAPISEYPFEPLAAPPDSTVGLARIRFIPGRYRVPNDEFYSRFSPAFGTSKRGPLDQKHFARTLRIHS